MTIALAACHAQVRSKGHVSTSEGDSDAEDRRWEVPEPLTQTAPERPVEPRKEAKVAAAVTSARVTTSPAEGSHMTFLGVTHDLSLSAATPRTEICRCLAIAYGTPSDPKWTWQGDVPHFDSDTVAVAIATDSVPCNGAAPLRRASIAGVEREGTDIVVFVENVSDGRPVMRGVLTSSPGPNAAIVVRTRSGAAYPAASGGGACRVVIK